MNTETTSQKGPNLGFRVLPQYIDEIRQQYTANMAQYPRKKAEVEAFLREKDDNFGLCLQFLYGHLSVMDIVSYSVEMIGRYVEASLAAYEKLSYVRDIPQDIFFSYVLVPRVNSENLDGSRCELMSQLLPFVQGKSTEQVALLVNIWCCSRATYAPSDDRTLSPFAVMRRTLGRCGEESVLLTAALRSVGIPARQCYCPRWSHCDDNHAWVEVWIDGEWYYLGACEPAPALNMGWFTAAASRAMLVHSKRWSHFQTADAVLHTTPLYDEVNCTARYADTQTLTIHLTEKGFPVSGAQVDFQIVNYSELFTLYRDYTDQNGFVQFRSGLGDLCVSVFHEGRMILKKVNTQQTGTLELDLEESCVLDALPQWLAMDLVPPVGRSDVAVSPDDVEALHICQQQREAYRATFPNPEGMSILDISLRESAGNHAEIQTFWDNPKYSSAQKEELLLTLRSKDFVDITSDTLIDALDTAETVRGQYPEDVFRDFILSPRIADEMLLPERAKIRTLFPDGFTSPEAVLAWMQQNIQIVDDHGIRNYYPSAYGCLYYHQCPAYSFDMVFVALCRAFRFPARLAPGTKKAQWLDALGQWHGIDSNESKKHVTLTLRNPTKTPLRYFEHFSLGYWNDIEFVTLQFADLTLKESCAITLAPGLYRIIITTRQIDGTASAFLQHIKLDQDCKLELGIPANQTTTRLKKVPLALPEGPVCSTLKEAIGENLILVFAEPGAEPTEHLLQELLECADDFNRENCQIRIFVSKQESMNNTTLQRVNAILNTVKTRQCCDSQAELAIHQAMQVSDLRLPFVILVDEQGYGVYAAANYNIRMAQTLLDIQKLRRGET